MLTTLLEGAWFTIQLTLLSAAVALGPALLAGFGMLSKSRWLRIPSRVYTEVFRGAPTLVLLFWFVYSLPLLGVFIAPLPAAVIALALSISAYEAEIVRGAIQAVPRGQREAAIALNLPARKTALRVIMPQAIVAMLPPYAGMTVQLLKTSALVSLVGLQDLTFSGDVLNASRDNPLQVYGLILVMYFLIALALTRSLRLLESYLSRWRPKVA